jgi:simple sugar transport system permease protein
MITVARLARPLARVRPPGAVLLPALALLAALLVGLALIGATGVPLREAMAAFWDGIAGSDYALVGSLTRSVPLALVGLGFILADRANLTNVGGEGQIAVGGMFATAAALYWGADKLPGPTSFLFPLLVGTLAGALWGAIAGVLKARRGANEVITTLLLTFVALQLVYGSVQSTSFLRQPVTDSSTLPESLELAERVQLPPLWSASGLPLHIGLVIEVLMAALVGVVLAKSAVGLRLRAVGLNELASRRAGLPVERLVVGTLAASGALGGMAGAIMIQGDAHYLTSGFSSGFGFDGLVVGLLARGSAPAVVVFALLFGCLRSGGMAMEMSAKVPSAVVLICQGLMVIGIAAAAALNRTSKR